ncbi:MULTISPECIES: hypothetical protein [unclassified Crossiella]|uniref:hypothetical protein n=1 Tax=unclassified Crossiella TaxID=2620835 RepID=UPI001FFF61C1|nr:MULTISPECIES: hypothetical protein [unclassified Crossiella]MCK2236896.1 hypothetical protein [Crossiella sp. S99.2]MCK2250564.1 hypothetical protein [Crossiella sp. S99.1]
MGDQVPVHDVIARFRAEVNAAVDRGGRAAAEAREHSDTFRGQTRDLTEQIRKGQLTPAREDLTKPGARTQATDFRTAQRLPVEDLPDGEQLLAPPPEPSPERGTQKQTKGANAWPSRMQNPRRTGDDEDFSQEQILY